MSFLLTCVLAGVGLGRRTRGQRLDVLGAPSISLTLMSGTLLLLSGGVSSRLRRDVLVDVEHVLGVVGGLDRGQPLVVVAIAGPDAVFALVHEEVDVGATRGVGVGG